MSGRSNASQRQRPRTNYRDPPTVYCRRPWLDQRGTERVIPVASVSGETEREAVLNGRLAQQELELSAMRDEVVAAKRQQGQARMPQ